jgi:hypothetical protein
VKVALGDARKEMLMTHEAWLHHIPHQDAASAASGVRSLLAVTARVHEEGTRLRLLHDGGSRRLTHRETSEVSGHCVGVGRSRGTHDVELSLGQKANTVRLQEDHDVRSEFKNVAGIGGDLSSKAAVNTPAMRWGRIAVEVLMTTRDKKRASIRYHGSSKSEKVDSRKKRR